MNYQTNIFRDRYFYKTYESALMAASFVLINYFEKEIVFHKKAEAKDG